MVKTECRRCRWRGTMFGEICCDYCHITGKSKIKLPQREDGFCPAYEEGKKERRLPKDPFRTIIIKGHSYAHEDLLALYNRGLTDGEIAREIGGVKSTVYKWRHRVGLPAHGAMPTEPKYDYDKFRALWAQGLSDMLIAKECGCARGTVAHWRKQEGLKSKGVPGMAPAIDRARMRELYDKGLNDVQIARELGCDDCTVNRWRHRNGLPARGR